MAVVGYIDGYVDENNREYGLTDTVAQGSINAIKDGSSIDSFGDVETALATKVDKVAGKGLSTNDYDNTAKGIVDNIQSNVIANTKLIKDTVGWTGKNLYDLVATSKTDQYGGVWTVDNENKTITVSGTPTAYEPFTTRSYDVLPIGNYIFSFNEDNLVNIGLDTARLYKNSVQVRALPTRGSSKAFTFSINADDDYDEIRIAFKRITNDVAMSGIIKPMLRKADILDPTYEPYRGTTAFPRDEQAVLGAKNLLENTANTQTLNGVTFTVNADKSVTVNGTATASSFLNIPVKLPKGRYIFSGTNGQTGGSDSKYYMRIRNTDGTRPTTITPLTVESINGSETVFEVSNDGLDARVNLCVYPEAGTLNNIIFYPMIRLASDTDSTYAPYAMTNRELTEKVFEKSVLTSADNLNDIKDTGIYGITSSPTGVPESASYCSLIVQKTSDGDIRQIIIKASNSGSSMYVRGFGGSPQSWTSWTKFTGTVVS